MYAYYNRMFLVDWKHIALYLLYLQIILYCQHYRTNCFLYKFVKNNEQLYVPLCGDYIFQVVVF